MAVHAPFAFAPVSRFVYFPEWAERVSHDVPFKDGVSGEIEIAITAHTPLLVGGPRRPATSEKEGEVWPVRLPNGAYAIPGSSLQGLIRSILEIATFGRLGPFVQKRRFGIRDLSDSETAKVTYRNRLVNNVKAGWLVKPKQSTDPQPSLYPCVRLAKVEFKEIVSAFGNKLAHVDELLTAENTKSGNDAQERLNSFTDQGTNLAALNAVLWVRKAEYGFTAHVDGEQGDDKTEGTLVITGKPQATRKHSEPRKHKRHEFFFSPARNNLGAVPKSDLIPSDVWRQFIYLHGGTEPGQTVNPNWAFWERVYDRGEPVPIFYIKESNAIVAIGTASMFKLAHRLSTHDLLCHSSPDHLEDAEAPYRLDLSSLIFGAVADDQGERGLRRRASFDLACASGSPQSKRSDPTVLLSPKPSYYPLYVRQAVSSAGSLKGTLYATYSPPNGGNFEPEVKWPEIGVKIWPSKEDACHFPKLPKPPAPLGSQQRDQVASKATVTSLNALPVGTSFTTKLRVHNLRKIELGALLWALTFGDRAALAGRPTRLRHRLGMGKPYQMGQIEIRVTSSALTANDPNTVTNDVWLAEAMLAFEDHMSSVSVAHGLKSWIESVQVKSLLRAADPARNKDLNLSYMNLGDPKAGAPGTYIGERKRNGALAEFAIGEEAPRRDESEGAGSITGSPTKFVVGARIRLLNDNEGVILELLPNDVAIVQLDEEKKPRRLRFQVLTVISAAPR